MPFSCAPCHIPFRRLCLRAVNSGGQPLTAPSTIDRLLLPRQAKHDPAVNGQLGTKDQYLRQHECLADFAQSDAFRRLMQRGLKALDRFMKIFGAETEGLMMDRHDEMRAGLIGHLHGLFRSAVRTNPAIVSADRRDRQLDGTKST